MGHYDFNGAKVLLAVIREGSFRKAALSLGIPKSNVSRMVQELEAQMGARLLHRTTRAISVTEAGRAFARHAELAVGHLEGASRAVSELQNYPKGTLRVTATVAMGQAFLGRMVADFLMKYPDVEVSLHLTARQVELVGERFDVAIRAGELPNSSLVSRLLGKSHYCLVASPGYLNRYGKPQNIEDLSSHLCLKFISPQGTVQEEWPLGKGKTKKGAKVNGPFSTDDFVVLREAAQAGVGIARIPRILVKDQLREGKLVTLLDSVASESSPIHLLYVGGRRLPQTTRAFVDFVFSQRSAVF